MANECDVRCPRSVVVSAEYDQQLADANPLRKVGVIAGLGALGMAQASRAAFTCPMRGLSAAEWQPGEVCVQDTQQILAEYPLDPARLTETQREILEPYLPGEPGTDLEPQA